jgi:hypothetical protein
VEQKKETRKRTWRRDSQPPTRQSKKAWTLRERWGKTVWEWMQLLIVPIALLLITVAFTWQQDARQQQIEDRRAEAERKLAEQRAQDEALQAYLDQMSTLLLEKDLSDDKVQTLIRARTVTVLSRMDPGRKTQVMQFLDEVNLLQRRVDERVSISLEAFDLSKASVNERAAVISLADADLSGADLIEVRLFRADLTDADLSNAKLHFASEARLVGANLTNADLASVVGQATAPHSHLRAADLTDANLTNANLIGADLSDADLTEANVFPEQLLGKVASLKGATLPNGQKYEDWLKDKKSRGEDGEDPGASS